MPGTTLARLGLMFLAGGLNVLLGGGAALGAEDSASPGAASVPPAASAPAGRHSRDVTLLAAGGQGAGAGGGGNHATVTTQPATQPSRTAEQRRQDDIDRVMEFIRVTQPDMYKQAEALRETDRPRFDKLIMNTLGVVNHLEQVKRRNPKLFELSMRDLTLGYRSLDLGHQLKRENLAEAEQIELRQRLRAAVEEDFDVQQKIHQIELDEMKARVKDLESQTDAREKAKDKLIQGRVDDVVKNEAKLEWKENGK